MTSLLAAIVLGALLAIPVILIASEVFDCEHPFYVACTFGVIVAIITYFLIAGAVKRTYENSVIALNMQLTELESQRDNTKSDNNFMITNEIARVKSRIFLQEQEKTYWWNWELR